MKLRFHSSYASSYPTYEEWKHMDVKASSDGELVYRSYPTYEEWKQGRKKYVKG